MHRLVQLAASPVVACRRQRLLRSLQLLLERAERGFNEQITEEVQASGRPIVRRQFDLALVSSLDHITSEL